MVKKINKMARAIRSHQRSRSTRRGRIVMYTVAATAMLSIGYLGAFFHKAEAFTQVFTVTNANDSGAGSLRQAIIDSNAEVSTPSNPNEITFDIANTDAANPAVQTISLQSELPQITQPLVIDGTTQQGARCGTLVPTDANGVIQSTNTPHTLKIEVTGVNAQNDLTEIFNFNRTAAGSSIKGLAVNGTRWVDRFIVDIDSPDTTVDCSYIGTKTDGATPVTQANSLGGGVHFRGRAQNARIVNSLISGQGGKGLLVGSGVKAAIVGNLVGTDATGKNYLPNATNRSAIELGDANDGSVLKNNIVNTASEGILFSGSTNDAVLQGNYVGTDISGTKMLSDHSYSIRFGDGDRNRIGGPALADRNVTISMLINGSQNAIEQNNYIGVKADGSSTFSSQQFDTGIYNNNASGVQIIENTIGGAKGYGIMNFNSKNQTTGKYSCDGQTVKGNYIGVTKDGVVIPNRAGVGIACQNTQIIDNIISGNSGSGISNGYEGNGLSATIRGNIIGLKPDGVTPAPNANGIALDDTSGKIQIGGANSEDRNTVAGNTERQITFSGSNVMARIQGNYVCLNKNGEQVVDKSIGLRVQGANLTIGGSAQGEGNIINCAQENIQQDVGSDNPIYYYGNTIGLNADGETPGVTTYSDGFGINLQGNTNVYFGGDQPGQGNVVAGMPQKWGFSILSLTDGAHSYRIQGNRYGITASGKIVGNYGPIQTAHVGGPPQKNVVIGGDTKAAGNIIAGTKSSDQSDWVAMSMGDGIVLGATDGAIVKNNEIYQNARNGITLYGNSEGNATIEYNSIHDNDGSAVGVSVGYDWTSASGRYDPATNNAIRFNSIYKNALIGIDLGSSYNWYSSGTFDGMSQNDTKDTDTGPNNLQNYPDISYSLTGCDGATQTAPGKFNSTPDTTFTLDYYSNPSSQKEQPLQGEKYISSETVTTDADGNADLNFPKDAVNPTVTATDANGNTSEFGGISQKTMTDCKLDQSVVSTQQVRYLSANNIFSIDGFSRGGAQVKVWVDDIEASGAYLLDRGGWQGQPFRYTGVYFDVEEKEFSVGLHDLTVEVVDSASGLSVKHTYKNGLKVEQAVIDYKTTITDNTAPTLSATPVDGVSDVRLYEILPAGSVDDGSVKPYTVLPTKYVTKTNSDGSQSSSPTSWQVITDPKLLQTYDFMEEYTYEYYPDSLFLTQPTLANMPTIDDLLSRCDANYENIQASHLHYVPDDGYYQWEGDPSVANCKEYIQRQYDERLSSSAIADIENRYNFTPLTDGKYDVFFIGYYGSSGQNFKANFPGGLIVDTLKPQVAITTVSNQVSPALTGTVNKNPISVKVKIVGRTYTAIVREDGTWFIPAGTIAPLAPGDYTIEVLATDSMGRTATATTHLSIIAAPEVSAPSDVGTVASVSATAGDDQLSATGDNMFIITAVGGILVIVAGIIGGGVLYRRHKQ